MRYLARLACALLIFLCACAASGDDAARPWREIGKLPSRSIPLPERQAYYDLAWLEDDVLVLVNNPTKNGPNLGGDLWAMTLDEFSLSRLPLPLDVKGCTVTDYAAPTALPDGRLGYTKWCALGPTGDKHWVEARDLQTGATEVLVGPTPDSPGAPSWNPSMTRAIVGMGSYICGGLLWLTPDGRELPGIVVRDEGATWRVDEYFRVEDIKCDVEGQADWPAWSPDGERIAFFGMPPTPGQGGFSRLDRPWSLFIMDSRRLQPRKVLEGIVGPHVLAWSPDNRWLTFGGEISGIRAIWLFSPDDRVLYRLTTFKEWFAWAPNGRALATLHDVGLGFPDAPHDAELRIFYVGPALDKLGRGRTPISTGRAVVSRCGEGKCSHATARRTRS